MITPAHTHTTLAHTHHTSTLMYTHHTFTRETKTLLLRKEKANSIVRF